MKSSTEMLQILFCLLFLSQLHWSSSFQYRSRISVPIHTRVRSSSPLFLRSDDKNKRNRDEEDSDDNDSPRRSNKISRDDLFDTLDLYWDDKLKLKMTELQLKIAEEYVGLRDGLYSSELGLKYKNGLLRVQEKINVLLAEFYRSRTADKKYKLINRHNKGRVCSTLEQRIDIVSEKDLELCRKEIEDFGLFLKNR